MLSFLKTLITRFRDDTRGAIVVETVITLPLLVWALAATYEFFEVYRYKSIREKATYVIADMISREAVEPGYIEPPYIINSLALLNDIVIDGGTNQLRVSIVRFTDPNGYEVQWSKVRGSGPMAELTTADINADLDRTPIMDPLEELIVVEVVSTYVPTFNVGLGNNIPIASRTFTSLREISKLCWGPDAC